jgi:hypothetical protein
MPTFETSLRSAVAKCFQWRRALVHIPQFSSQFPSKAYGYALLRHHGRNSSGRSRSVLRYQRQTTRCREWPDLMQELLYPLVEPKPPSRVVVTLSPAV